jgi:hypothetical protein
MQTCKMVGDLMDETVGAVGVGERNLDIGGGARALYRTDTEQHLTALCVSYEAQSEIFRLLRQDTSLSESNSALIIHSVG